MNTVLFPALYQLNIRVYLRQLSKQLGRRATLDDFPEEELEGFVKAGFNWIWLLSVWQTGKKGMEISRQHPGWRNEFIHTLPDLEEEDIPGSGFAITEYGVHPDLGGREAMIRFRHRLNKKGMKLMLDFVPNHTAIDHPWVEKFPSYYIHGNEELLSKEPVNYIKVSTSQGELILAHGRDPYFDGWPDTLQLNYGNPELQEAMMHELLLVADQCDGVRCDMALLLLPEVFERTWGVACDLFWPRTILRVNEKYPEFRFMAEVYWDMEWTLQQQGFDYTYDKRLYDRLKVDNANSIRQHFYADWEYQIRLVRFLENHDENRAAEVFTQEKHEAAAIITYFSPGLKFFHQGQLEGQRVRISPHLNRGPEEPLNKEIKHFYTKLLLQLSQPVFRSGSWKLLNVSSAWQGNESHENYIGFAWVGPKDEKALVIVNYASRSSQCYLEVPFTDLGNREWRLIDQFSKVSYLRNGNDLSNNGLYLDEPAWKYYLFYLSKT